jgi:hypothetical protein
MSSGYSVADNLKRHVSQIVAFANQLPPGMPPKQFDICQAELMNSYIELGSSALGSPAPPQPPQHQSVPPPGEDMWQFLQNQPMAEMQGAGLFDTGLMGGFSLGVQYPAAFP